MIANTQRRGPANAGASVWQRSRDRALQQCGRLDSNARASRRPRVDSGRP